MLINVSIYDIKRTYFINLYVRKDSLFEKNLFKKRLIKLFLQNYQMPVENLTRHEEARIAKEIGQIVLNLAKMPAKEACTIPLSKLWEKLKYGDFYCYGCNSKLEERGYCIEIPDIDLKKEVYCMKCGQKEVNKLIVENNIEKFPRNPLKKYNLEQLKKIKEIWTNIGKRNF